MHTPTPVGRVHFDEPRAAFVREPETLDKHHSVVHCGINIHTDTMKETRLIMSYWGTLMREVDKWVDELLKQNSDN